MENVREILNWYIDAGVDLALEDHPVDRFTEITPTPVKRTTELPKQSLERTDVAPEPQRPLSSEPRSQATLPDGAAIKTAQELAASANDIEALRNAMSQFEGCNLRLTAKTLVFADGNPEAQIMFVGEAPGRDEDLQGLPFVGRSGQLLDRILSAIGLNRETAYISNVIPWRPPGNRPPTPQETEICRPFIERHIELVNPKVLVMLGGSSAKTLLKTTDGIMRLRGKWCEYSTGNIKTQAMPTLHPAYLLRQPAHKKLAWQDFLKISQSLKKSN